MFAEYVDAGDDQVVVATDGMSPQAWLQAADIIVGRHHTSLQAYSWIATIHDQYPGCAVAVSWRGRERLFLIGLAGLAVVLCGEGLDAAEVVMAAVIVHNIWTNRNGGRS